MLPGKSPLALNCLYWTARVHGISHLLLICIGGLELHFARSEIIRYEVPAESRGMPLDTSASEAMLLPCGYVTDL